MGRSHSLMARCERVRRYGTTGGGEERWGGDHCSKKHTLKRYARGVRGHVERMSPESLTEWKGRGPGATGAGTRCPIKLSFQL